MPSLLSQNKKLNSIPDVKPKSILKLLENSNMIFLYLELASNASKDLTILIGV
jgi:hypothetical protein